VDGRKRRDVIGWKGIYIVRAGKNVAFDGNFRREIVDWKREFSIEISMKTVV